MTKLCLLLLIPATAAARQTCELVGTRLDAQGAISQELRCQPDPAPGGLIDCMHGSCRVPEVPGYVRDGEQPWDDELGGLRRFSSGRRMAVPSRAPVVVWTEARATSCQGFVAAAAELQRQQREAEANHRDLSAFVFGKTRPTFRPLDGDVVQSRDVDGKTRVSARRRFRVELTILVPDPTAPPWPSPTAQETADWRRWCENIYWHEIGHAHVAELMESLELDIVGEGASRAQAMTAFLEDLYRRPMEAFLAAQAPYDADTDHGRLQFPAVDFHCSE